MSEQITLIGLSGLAGTGKTEAAKYLCRAYGFVQADFAEPLRESVAVLLESAGVDQAYLTDRRLKETVIPQLGYSARALMQEWGESARKLDPECWIKHLAERIQLRSLADSPVHDRIVIGDVRHVNEAQWLYGNGGRVVRLHRDTATPVRDHVSEQQVSDLPAYVDLWNNGPTLVGLHGLLDGVMADFGIEPRDALDGFDNPSL